MKNMYRSRILQSILVIAIALLLIAGVAAFTHQWSSAHAQMPGGSLASKQHSSTKGCSSVDKADDSNLDVALAQCGEAGNLFKATVVDPSMTATRTSITASIKEKKMTYTNQCNHFACSTARFMAMPGDVVCYQASAGAVHTNEQCYTIPSGDSSSSSPSLK